MTMDASAHESTDNLTDPISLELFEDPVQTPCCGNTLSRLSLRFALPRCPLCRKDIAEEHPAFKIDEVPINRAVAHLVDAHKAKQNQAHAASAPVQPAEPKTKPMLPSGSTVRLHGLNARPELNGLVGTVGDFVEAKGRYAVRLLDRNESILLRPVNLSRERGGTPAYKRAEQQANQMALRRAQRVRVGGGLAATREAGVDAGRTVGERGAVLSAVLDGLSSGKLCAFSDAPNYDRLLLASRRLAGDLAGPYTEHLVEACLAHEEVGGGGDVAEGLEDATERVTDVTDDGTHGEAAGGEAAGARGASAYSCGWVMMDYTMDDLASQGLAPMDPPTVRDYFGPAFGIIERCQLSSPAKGKSAVYTLSADPNVTSPEDDDTAFLVEQMLGDSSLRFLLPPAALERIGAKRPVSQADVNKALEAFSGSVSMRKR